MQRDIPLYLKIAVILIGISFLYLLLLHGKFVLAPIALAFIISIAVYPIFAFYFRKGIPEVPAILLAILSVFVVLGALIIMVYFQLLSLVADSPEYIAQLEIHLTNIQLFIERKLGVDTQLQTEYISEQVGSVIAMLPNLMITFFNTFVELLFFTILVSIYTFLFLYYRELFKEFFAEQFGRIASERIVNFYKLINDVVQNYIGGLFLVMVILAVLNSVALAIIGIDHAIFFGVLAALLTIIPYIGVFIGSLLPVLFALITKDSLFYPLAILITFDVIQFLEGNFITPNVMGNKVNISPLMIIIALFIGGIIWGPIGMILSVPYLAILKVILGHLPQAKPYEDLITGYSYEGEDSLFKRVYNIIKSTFSSTKTGS